MFRSILILFILLINVQLAHSQCTEEQREWSRDCLASATDQYNFCTDQNDVRWIYCVTAECDWGGYTNDLSADGCMDDCNYSHRFYEEQCLIQYYQTADYCLDNC